MSVTDALGAWLYIYLILAAIALLIFGGVIAGLVLENDPFDVPYLPEGWFFVILPLWIGYKIGKWLKKMGV